jgi:hypothetical protein
MRLHQATLLILIAAAAALKPATLAAQATSEEVIYPAIPLAALESYQASIFDEPLESMRMPRLRLAGSRTLTMDIIPEHNAVPTQGECSARFEITNAPDFKVEFFSFPAARFEFELDDATLNLYLKGLSLSHTPEQAFKIIEESAFDENGPAKFRILGQRAMTVRYSYQIEERTLVYGENWIERDGTIYIVRVIAPQRTFDLQFQDVRVVFNSISEQE